MTPPPTIPTQPDTDCDACLSPVSPHHHSSPRSPPDSDDELPPTPTTPDMVMDMDVPESLPFVHEFPPPTPTTPDIDIPESLPFVHEFPFPSDESLFDFRADKFRTFFAPPIPELEFLPELDDIPDSPDSPSLRLPSLYDDDDDDGLTSPPSPGATLVPLPSADPEDDVVSPSDRLPPPFSSPTGSLLLLEDEPLPRSPSPEACDVDPVCVEASADPDVRRLGELRRRSLLAERAARQLELTLLEQGAVHQRWEARRARKKEKERGREIGAMLRLKMGREGERDAIGGMEQLVAKMLLRRNDTYRSLANRKTPLTFKFHKSSPLVRYGDSGGLDVDVDDQLKPAPWTGRSGSDPRTLSAWTSSPF